MERGGLPAQAEVGPQIPRRTCLLPPQARTLHRQRGALRPQGEQACVHGWPRDSPKQAAGQRAHSPLPAGAARFTRGLTMHMLALKRTQLNHVGLKTNSRESISGHVISV